MNLSNISGFVQGKIYYHIKYLHCYVSILYIAAIDKQVFFHLIDISSSIIDKLLYMKLLLLL